MKDTDERVHVRNAPNRCPFCHTDCGPDDDNVVCNDCLARHHRACWSSHGACGSCRSNRSLGSSARPPLTSEQAAAVLAEAGYSATEVAGLLAPRAAAPSHVLVGLTALGVLPLLVYPLFIGGGNVNMELGYLMGASVFLALANGLLGRSLRSGAVTPIVLVAAQLVSLATRGNSVNDRGVLLIVMSLLVGIAAGVVGSQADAILAWLRAKAR